MTYAVSCPAAPSTCSCFTDRAPQSGIVVKKTNTAMVIGLFDEGVQPGDCNVVVENLGDYLIGTRIHMVL